MSTQKNMIMDEKKDKKTVPIRELKKLLSEAESDIEKGAYEEAKRFFKKFKHDNRIK